jgi:hypothetical protein
VSDWINVVCLAAGISESSWNQIGILQRKMIPIFAMDLSAQINHEHRDPIVVSHRIEYSKFVLVTSCDTHSFPNSIEEGK